MRHGELPTDVVHVRETNVFDKTTVPQGLTRTHQLAAGVWGVLDVVDGHLHFVFEAKPDEPLRLGAGDSVVIRPEIVHHVELHGGARFRVSFYS